MQMVKRPQLSLDQVAGALTPTAHRTVGCHVSSCIKEIVLSIDPNAYGKAAVNRDAAMSAKENFWYSGYLWEEILGTGLQSAIGKGADIVRGGELVTDQIYGTPDWYLLTETVLRLGESKVTWKSSRDFDIYEPKFVGWLFQIRAYCYMAGLLDATLFVLFINSDYNHSQWGPTLEIFDFTFTPQELKDNWRQIVGVAKKKGWI